MTILNNDMHYALEEASELCAKKSEDYNGKSSANVTDPARRSYFPYGPKSYLHMLHTKFKRIEQVTLGSHDSPNYESVRDSLLDLINYSSFFVAYIDQQEKVSIAPLTLCPQTFCIGLLRQHTYTPLCSVCDTCGHKVLLEVETGDNNE